MVMTSGHGQETVLIRRFVARIPDSGWLNDTSRNT
jgi:hypothetical protein